MFLMKMNRLFFILGFFALLAIPLMVPAFGTVQMSAGDIETAQISRLIPIIVLVEIFVYFFFGLISGSAASTLKLIQYSIFMVFVRFIICFLAAVIFALFKILPQSYAVILFWVGNPPLALIQIFILMFYGPHLAISLGTQMVNEESEKTIRCELSEETRPAVIPPYSGAAPIGGFVHIFNFDELGRHLSNIIGMEGFVLYTWEGLILWENCPLRVDKEKLAVRSLFEWQHLKDSQIDSGFGEPGKFISETSDHRFIHIAIDTRFFGVMILKKETDLGDVMNRISVQERSIREFLDMRYSLLLQ